MARVVAPLLKPSASPMKGRGAKALMPLTLHGAQAMPRRSPGPCQATASAQVKSALLLAALNAHGTSRISSQDVLTRDHSEKMLKAAFGAKHFHVAACTAKVAKSSPWKAPPGLHGCSRGSAARSVLGGLRHRGGADRAGLPWSNCPPSCSIPVAPVCCRRCEEMKAPISTVTNKPHRAAAKISATWLC